MALSDLLARADHAIADGSLFALLRGYHQVILTANVTLDDTFPAVVGFDPGAANRTITLDGAAAAAGDGAVDGLLRLVVNRAPIALRDLIVQDATPAAIGTIGQNQAGLFYHDEDTGWTLVALFSIALA